MMSVNRKFGVPVCLVPVFLGKRYLTPFPSRFSASRTLLLRRGGPSVSVPGGGAVLRGGSGTCPDFIGTPP